MGTWHSVLAGTPGFPRSSGQSWMVSLIVCTNGLLVFCWVLSLTRNAVRLTQKALCRFQGQEPFSSSKEENEEATILGILKRLYTGNYSRLVCLFPAFELLLELDQNCLECYISSFKPWASVYIPVCMYSAVQSCTICGSFPHVAAWPLVWITLIPVFRFCWEQINIPTISALLML